MLRADDLGHTRGDGCFEGCRVRTDDAGASRIDKLDAHLARMSRSAGALEIEFEPSAWQAFVTESLTAWTLPGEASLRLVLTRGRPGVGVPTGLLTIVELPPGYPAQRRDGIRVVTLSRGTTHDAFTDAPWLLGGVKTLSYAVNMAAVREAERQGADDAILVSADGYVLESTTGSVIWSRGRTLHTTPLDGTGILGGTTQQLLFERAPAAGWHTETVSAQLADLHAADTLWLTSSVRGPVEVVELDGEQRVPSVRTTREIQRLSGF